MLTLTLVFALAVAPQAQKAPATAASVATSACTLLTAQEIGSLVGKANAIPMTKTPTASTCMLQNEDKIVTVMVVSLPSAEAAKGTWEKQKRVMSAQDVPGWPGQAFSAAIERPKEHVAIVGIVKDKLFVEVKVLDVTKPAAALQTTLQSVMKALAGRL